MVTRNRFLGDNPFQTTITPGGRLNVEQVPVDTGSASTARTTVYYHPYCHNQIPVWDGNGWNFQQIPDAGFSSALDSTAAHTGYHQSGKVFDLFYANVAGTLYFGTGPAWTNNTTRAAATALTYKGGLRVNNTTMTMKFDATSSTVSVPTNQATYLGTFSATADGTTKFYTGGSASGGTAALLHLWNMYNRRMFTSAVIDTGTPYAYTTAAWRQMRGSAAMQVNFTTGLAEDAMSSIAWLIYNAGGNGINASGNWGIGLDSTTASYLASSSVYIDYNVATNTVGCLLEASAHSIIAPQIGLHYISGLENASVGGGNYSAGTIQAQILM